MEIRKMTESDVPRVALLEAEIFSDAWSPEGFYDSLKNPDALLLVAEEDGDIAGYCCVYTVLDEGEIVNVAVSPARRRRGVGVCMLGELFERFVSKTVSHFYLEVRKSNDAARQLYEKLGFCVVGSRKNFYEKPTEDALIMQMVRGSGANCQ